jgi:hypothetical protein
MKRIQEAREGLPPVETVLGLDEMQVRSVAYPRYSIALTIPLAS